MCAFESFPDEFKFLSKDNIEDAVRLGSRDDVEYHLEKASKEEVATWLTNEDIWIAAITEGHLDIIKLFLKRKKPNVSQLNFLKTVTVIECHPEVFQLFETVFEEKDEIFYEGLLLLAAGSGSLNIVEILVAQKISFGAFPLTALHLATINGHLDVVQFLIEHGSDVNAADKLGFTPLLLAAIYGHAKIAECLLQNEANVNAASSFGDMTALNIAAFGGNEDVVMILLNHDADLKDSLHAAVEGGHLHIVSMLIEHGADVNGKGLHNVTHCLWLILWNANFRLTKKTKKTTHLKKGHKSKRWIQKTSRWMSSI